MPLLRAGLAKTCEILFVDICKNSWIWAYFKKFITWVDLQLLFTVEIEVKRFQSRHQPEMSETATSKPSTSTIAWLIIAEEDRVWVRLAEDPRFSGAVLLSVLAGDGEDCRGGWHLGFGRFQYRPPVHQRVRLWAARIEIWLGSFSTTSSVLTVLQSDNS